MEIEKQKNQDSTDTPLIIDGVSINENVVEVAFCDSPIHDFDRCPFIEQRNDCKSCRYYN